MKNNDNAVSPVIGVLLMLVVTIIIAAVVSSFAGGLAQGQTKAPQASIGVLTSTTYGYFEISFTHQGGDSIPTNDVKIVTKLTLPNGSVVQHETTKNSNISISTSTSGYGRVPMVCDKFTYGTYGSVKQADIDADGFVEPTPWFGKYTLSKGAVARTYYGTAAFLGLVNESLWYPYSAANYADGEDLLDQCISNHTSLYVGWVHIPSSKIIFEKTLTMEN